MGTSRAAGTFFSFGLSMAVLFCPAEAFPGECDQIGGEDCDGNSVPDVCELRKMELFPWRVSLPISLPSFPPTATVAFDLGGEGDLDLAMAGSRLTIFENEGGLKFAVSGLVSGFGTSQGVAAGDLDGDGATDLAVTKQASIWAQFQRGGKLGSSLVTAIAPDPSGVVLADFDLDGDLDMAAVVGRGFSILRNDGHGLFFSQLSFPLDGAIPASVVTADLDGDGDPDIAYVSDLGSQVLWNLGQANFQAKEVPFLFGKSLAAVDLDGDRALDLVTEAALARNRGRGEFSPAESYHSVAFPGTVTAADIDRDGRMDIALTSEAEASLTVLFQRVPGSFSPVIYPVAGPAGSLLASADFDGDGAPEIVLGAEAIIEFAPTLQDHDCNRNGKLDSCDLKAGTSRDCDRNGIPDECELDCNSDGIEDTCETGDGTVPDCNRNSIPDSCEIERGTAPDSDGDGVPDECEAVPPLFAFGLEGYPLEVRGSPGELVTFEVFVNLTTTGNTSQEGAQGWTFFVFVSEGVIISSITLDGLKVSTIYDEDADGDPSTPPVHHDPYFHDLGDSFTHVAAMCRGPQPIGVYSAVILTDRGKMVLQPNGTQRVARIVLQKVVPPGPECVRMSLRPPGGDWWRCAHLVYSAVTLEEKSYQAQVGSAEILICPSRFRRGDANSDGVVDISDAVTSLGYLYLGGETPGCLKAADANDDGQVDISDPVLTLTDLFSPLSGTRLPLPGPFACGTDPSPDQLGCFVHLSCL